MLSKKVQIIIISVLAAVLVAAVAVLIVIVAGPPKAPETEAPVETEETLSETETESTEAPTEPTEPEWTEMTAEDPVKITEVLFKNTYSLIDEFGERAPWVEVYNAGQSPINLSAYCLSDDPEDPEKWRFPDEILLPGAYRVVFLTASAVDSNHTGFKVSKKEGLVLSDMELRRYQLVDPDGDSREDNISYGEQGGKWLYFGVPTPGRENTSHGSETVASSVSFNPQGLFISEVSAAHTAMSGETDWIELFNGGEEPVDLTGFSLSDDADELALMNLSGTVAPGEYFLLKASKESADWTGNAVHFSLSESGEGLFLTDPEGIVIDTFSTGALRKNVSSGRETGSETGARVFFETPTPGAPNSAASGGILAAPAFSLPGGFYDGPVTVTLSGAGEIHYTLDSSMPTLNSPLYTEPLTIDKNTAVSAVAFLSGNLPSDRVTETFILEAMPSLPTVCLSISDADLAAIFSEEVQHRPTTTIIERECYMEYYETDGRLGAASPAGARIAGDSTRVYPQKSICLYFRSGYGRSSVTYPFFEDYEQIEFSSLLLRNAGQDTERTRMADTYCSMLAKGMNIDYAESRFAVVFINGRYYGIYDLKENQNEDYMSYKHGGLDTSKMNVIRRNYFLLEGSTRDISAAYEFAKTENLADPAVYEEFSKMVDVDAFIDYIVLQSFIGNDDMYNQKYWNVDGFETPIRPVLFDLDFGIYAKNSDVLPLYFSGDGIPGSDGTTKTNMWIPTALLKNPEWKEKLIQRIAWAVNDGFQGAVTLFDRMVEEIRPEMARHIARWPRYGLTMEKWEANIAHAREVLLARPERMKKTLRNYLGVSEARMKELFPGE